ncbi:MAG: phage tail protein [Calditrichia bacterium]
MATGDRRDPFRNFRFRVEIDGVQQAGFSEATGFDATVDVIEYRDGNENTTVRKLPGLTKYGNITLKRGVTNSTELFEWHLDVVRGNIERRNMSIVLMDESGNDAARWNIINAWPTKYDPPDFNAKGNDVAIESLEIVCEGVELDT